MGFGIRKLGILILILALTIGLSYIVQQKQKDQKAIHQEEDQIILPVFAYKVMRKDSTVTFAIGTQDSVHRSIGEKVWVNSSEGHFMLDNNYLEAREDSNHSLVTILQVLGEVPIVEIE